MRFVKGFISLVLGLPTSLWIIPILLFYYISVSLLAGFNRELFKEITVPFTYIVFSACLIFYFIGIVKSYRKYLLNHEENVTYTPYKEIENVEINTRHATNQESSIFSIIPSIILRILFAGFIVFVSVIAAVIVGFSGDSGANPVFYYLALSLLFFDLSAIIIFLCPDRYLSKPNMFMKIVYSSFVLSGLPAFIIFLTVI